MVLEFLELFFEIRSFFVFSNMRVNAAGSCKVHGLIWYVIEDDVVILSSCQEIAIGMSVFDTDLNHYMISDLSPVVEVLVCPAVFFDVLLETIIGYCFQELEGREEAAFPGSVCP